MPFVFINSKKMDQETIQLLKTDGVFAAKFALDNNFPAIQSKLLDKGYVVNDKTAAFSKIMELASLGKSDILQYIFNVPYNNGATNGTGGFADYFVSVSAPPSAPEPGTRFNWSGLLTTVGIVLTGAGVALSGTSPTGTTETPEQKAAREAAEAEEKRKKMIWMWIGIIFGLGIIALIIWLIVRKKKKTN